MAVRMFASPRRDQPSPRSPTPPDGNRRVGERIYFPRSSLFRTLATVLSFFFDLQVFVRKETGSLSSSERIPSIPLTHPLNVS